MKSGYKALLLALFTTFTIFYFRSQIFYLLYTLYSYTPSLIGELWNDPSLSLSSPATSPTTQFTLKLAELDSRLTSIDRLIGELLNKVNYIKAISESAPFSVSTTSSSTTLASYFGTLTFFFTFALLMRSFISSKDDELGGEIYRVYGDLHSIHKDSHQQLLSLLDRLSKDVQDHHSYFRNSFVEVNSMELGKLDHIIALLNSHEIILSELLSLLTKVSLNIVADGDDLRNVVMPVLRKLISLQLSYLKNEL